MTSPQSPKVCGKDDIQVTIEKSPYGDAGAVYDGMLGMMQHYILQLSSFRSQQHTDEERAYLEADIRGYKEIVKAGKQSNARKFMEIKHESRMTGKEKFANNEKIVEHMKASGLWE